MNINGTIALNPTDSRKSFYGKAVVLLCSNGDKILRSYATNVAKIDSSGNFHKLWDGYSATTMRHISAFCNTFGINIGRKSGWTRKKWWESLTTERG